MDKERRNIWWGPPKTFSLNRAERKISWLELFYDLVYAIIISRTTRLLAINVSWDGVLNYTYLFLIIFWGWFNGSMHHDIHGSPGIRTRFMTLWQMMAVAILAVALDSPNEHFLFRTTIAVAILQGYITYLWLSVGIYDKQHRRLNRPFIFCYLLGLALIITTLYVPQPYKSILFGATLFVDYFPFFVTRAVSKADDNFTISSSMVERLGLLTIIVFGESILGVINGMDAFTHMEAKDWVCFGLGILTVFCLWWIFFSIIADREGKQGTKYGRLIPTVYIPILASLGIIGANFPGLIKSLAMPFTMQLQISAMLYGVSLAVFLWCTVILSRLLVYPPEYRHARARLQPLIIISGIVIFLLTMALTHIPLVYYMLCNVVVLFVIIVLITRIWFKLELDRIANNEER